MSDVNGIQQGNYEYQSVNNSQEKSNIDLEDIQIVYETTQDDTERGTFDESFQSVPKEASEQGNQFLTSLIENKSKVMYELGITNEEEYDSLACVALALASQETGMGKEKGYNEENQGLGQLTRVVGKFISETFFGDSSASSGLTQMKIYDFMNSKDFPDKYKQAISECGVVVNGRNRNNLYKEPDKAAIATVAVLKYIGENYGQYTTELMTQHKNLINEIANSPEKQAAVDIQSEETMSQIKDIYDNAPEDKKNEIRATLKDWMLSKNGSKIGDKDVDIEYNEEANLSKLNALLKECGANFELNDYSLDLIRYALTKPGEEMSQVEYLAYGWNKGTGGTGMQLDRMLAEKLGTIFRDPEDMDYDQFTANVTALAEKYAEQSVGRNGFDALNYAFG